MISWPYEKRLHLAGSNALNKTTSCAVQWNTAGMYEDMFGQWLERGAVREH